MLSTEADLLSGNPESAMRVQEAIGSRSSAIHKGLSRFAAPFKGARAKISITESCSFGPSSFPESLRLTISP